MINNKSVIAIIPARGGSKGLPGKNIRQLCGKPLIGWSIEQALKSKLVDRVVVSTDSAEIAEISKQHGADVPFLRPSEMAEDSSPTSDAVIHVLERLAAGGEKYDYIMLLEPTSPLRKADDLDRSFKMLTESDEADTMVSLGKVHMEHPLIVKRIDPSGYMRPYIQDAAKIHQRQQADEAYFPYGVVYISKVSTYFEKKTFYTDHTLPFFIERWQNFEIDDEVDFLITERIMQLKIGV